MSSEPAGFATGAVTQIWTQLCAEAIIAAERHPVVTRAMNAAVLYHASFGQALAHRVAQKLGSHHLDQDGLLPFICQAFLSDPTILAASAADLAAMKDRDRSNSEFLTPFLYFKGFLALQAQRVAHWLGHRAAFTSLHTARRRGDTLPTRVE